MRLLAITLALAACGAPSSHPGVAIDAPRTIDTPPDGDIDGPTIVQDSCITDPHAGHSAISCNGIVFDVEVPAACAQPGCGLILDVHGLTMSAQMEDANTDLRAKAGAAGFIVIQPNANPAPPQASWSTTDDPKIFDFVTRAIAVYRVDPKRVHMTGFSQGGFMTWRFLCDHSDTFASVAPGAAASNCGSPACTFTGTEVPSHQIPVLYMHGRQDTDYVQFSCAQPQVDAVAAAWGLTSQGVIASSPTYSRTRYAGAGAGLLEFIAHDYSSNAQFPGISSTKLLGHCYPGSTDPGGAPGQLFSFKCDQTASFTWGDEVLAFFVAHPLP